MAPGHPFVPHSNSLASIWRRIAKTLSAHPYHLPELPDSLSYPASQESLNSLQSTLSSYDLNLPLPVRDHFLVHDGQDVFSHAASGLSGAGSTGLVWGLWLMSCEEVETEWGFWRRLDDGLMPGDAFAATDFSKKNSRPSIGDHHPSHHQLSLSDQQTISHLDPRMSSCPSGWVREVYSHPGWLPLLSDRAGNYIGVDLSPPMFDSSPHSIDVARSVRGGGQGHATPEVGQVIAFGREIDEKVVLWRGEGRNGWANWLASFVDDLEDQSFAGLGLASNHPRRHSHSSQKARADSTTSEMGWFSTSADSEADEDGLGDMGYFNDGSGYGTGVNDFHGWKLAPEYRGMSVIEALCARSKKRWAEIGLHSSRSQRSQSVRSHSSQFTTEGSIHSPLEQGSSVSPSEYPSATCATTSTSVITPSTTDDRSSPLTPIAFVTPPSPRLSTEPPSVDSTSPNSPSDPRLIPIKRRDHHYSSTNGSCNPRPRRPLPAPMSLDLPTMDSLMSICSDREDSEKGDETGFNPELDFRSPNTLVNRLSMVTRRLSEEMNRMAIKNHGSHSAHSSHGLNADVIGMGLLNQASPIRSADESKIEA